MTNPCRHKHPIAAVLLVFALLFFVGAIDKADSKHLTRGKVLRVSEHEPLQQQESRRHLFKEKKKVEETDKQVPTTDDPAPPTEDADERRSGGTTLLLLDMQNCLLSNGGALPIDGAYNDSLRIAKMIHKHTDSIDRIIATMDSLDKLHIAHPGFWIDDDGYHPNPYTVITYEDVKSQKYIPNPRIEIPLHESEKMIDKHYFGGEDYKDLITDDEDDKDAISLYRYALAYLQNLNDTHQYNHILWPEHCLVGAQGHAMVPHVMDALLEWSEATGKTVQWVEKGRHQMTECFSCMRAQVVVDEETDYNHDLYDSLVTSEELLVA